MALNAKPKILHDNVLEHAVLSATNTDSDTKYHVDFLKDPRAYTKWKAASVGTRYLTFDLNNILNAGFETGDFTNWTAQDAIIDAVVFNSGAKSSKLVAAGSNVDGALSDAYKVDTDRLYKCIVHNNVTVRSAGTYYAKIHFYSEAAGTTLISSSTLDSWSAVSGGWATTSKDVGPGGDIEFPAGTKSIRIEDSWDTTPTGTAYMDDVLFYINQAVDALAILGHNLHSANATVSYEWSDDDTEVISSWTEEIPGFLPASDKIIGKIHTSRTKRALRIKIITAGVVPKVGAVFAYELFTFPKYNTGAWDPDDDRIKLTTEISAEGNDLGTNVRYSERKPTLRFKNLTPSWYIDTFLPIWRKRLKHRKTFIMFWDTVNHADEIYAMRIDTKRLSSPYTPTRRNLVLPIRGVTE